MAAETVRLALKQGRSGPVSGPVNRLAGGFVHGFDVHAVDACAGDAIGGGPIGDIVQQHGSFVVRRKAVEVVFADEDDR